MGPMFVFSAVLWSKKYTVAFAKKNCASFPKGCGSTSPPFSGDGTASLRPGDECIEAYHEMTGVEVWLVHSLADAELFRPRGTTVLPVLTASGLDLWTLAFWETKVFVFVFFKLNQQEVKLYAEGSTAAKLLNGGVEGEGPFCFFSSKFLFLFCNGKRSQGDH